MFRVFVFVGSVRDDLIEVIILNEYYVEVILL